MREHENTIALPGGWLGLVVKAFDAWRLRTQRASASRQMHLVEALALGPKKQLMLVRCGERLFLVGTGADSVQTIVCITGELS